MLSVEVTSYDHKPAFTLMMLPRVPVRNIKVESTLRSVSWDPLLWRQIEEKHQTLDK